jgi:PAS domain S-box-containing protein
MGDTRPSREWTADVHEVVLALAAVAEHVPFDIWVCDREERCIYQNAMSRQHWGERVGERTCDMPVPPNVLQRWSAANARAFSGDVVREEVEFAYKGGARLVSNMVVPVVNGGAVVAIAGINFDVTERRRAEHALVDSEERFRAAFESSALGMAIVSLDGRFLMVNARFCELLGREETEIVGQAGSSVTHPDDIARTVRCYQAVARGELAVGRIEKRILRGDSHIWVQVSATAVRDPSGQPRYFFHQVENIHERKRFEDELRQSEGRLRALMEQLPDAVIVHRDGRVVYANAAAVRTLGHRRSEDLLGAGVLTLVHPDDVSGLRRRILALASDGTSTESAEERLLRRDGSFVSVEMKTLRIAFDGAPALMSIARDVSEEKALRAKLAQADRLATVGSLATGVAHEINNPLTYVLANLTSVAKDLDAAKEAGRALLEKLQQRVRLALDGVNRIRGIVRDLRTFSRTDNDAVDRVHVDRVLEAVVGLASSELMTRVRVEKAIHPVPAVLAHEGRLSQVFLNLVVNAVHAMEARPGDHVLRLSSFVERGGAPERGAEREEQSLEQAGQGEQWVCVRVEDTGAGIAPEHLGRLFDPFFTTKPIGVGSGLGLAICRNIVTAYGGTIDVASVLGRGSSFTVRLPPAPELRADDGVEDRRDPADARGTPALARGSTRTGAGSAVGDQADAQAEEDRDGHFVRTLRLLVVDDEPHVVDAVRTLLPPSVDVATAYSGAEACTMLDEEAPFDAVLCDLMMPGVTGIDVYAHIRDKHPGLARHTGFMTGGALSDRAAEFFDRNAQLCIGKPFDGHELRAFVAKLGRARGR